MMGSFLFGAACGLVTGIVFGHAIWTWIKGIGQKADEAIQKNAPKGTNQNPHDTL